MVQTITYVVPAPDKPVNARKQKTAFPPNFVHSQVGQISVFMEFILRARIHVFAEEIIASAPNVLFRMHRVRILHIQYYSELNC